MAKILAIMDVMPENVELNLDELKEKVKKEIESFGAEFGEVKEEEVAFGLKRLKFVIISDEDKGGFDPLEENVRKIDGVKSAEIVDVRRAIG